jgi:DNA-binding NarL/FixJ family response regulator
MKILVIENSAVICERLLALLAESGKYEALGCVTCAVAALELVEACRPDALLLDLRLSDGSGLRVLEGLHKMGSAVPVVVLSENDGWHYRAYAQTMGAAAFLRKSTQFDQIVPTLDRVLGGEARKPANAPCISEARP